jgi:Tol biopolymer transport system component
VWVIARGGGMAVQITTDPGGDTDPTWSGDGSTIAYTHSTATCSCIRTAETVPDYAIGVQPWTWTAVKQFYR